MVLLLLLFLVSGATGLVYELIWTRELVFVFGGTTYAITTVLVGFMGGLGLGGFLAGRHAARLRRPARVYGLLEIAIGLYALAVPWLLELAGPLYAVLYPLVVESPLWLNVVRFLVGGVIMLVPATAMGATLPILVTYAHRAGLGVGRAAALMYGVNTLGAVLGVVGTGFVLIPTLGLSTTTLVAAAGNLLVGVLAITLFGRADAQPAAAPASPAAGLEAAPLGERAWRATLVTYAVSGFTAMVYQIAWTRVLVMSIGSSTYAFTCILAAFILGLALGGLAAGRVIDRVRRPLAALAAIQLAIALAAVLVVGALGWAPVWVHGLVRALQHNYGLLLAVEFALVIAIVLVPTLLLGAAFPFVTRLLAARAASAGDAAGRAYGVNTIGTVIGACLAGFVLIRSDIGLGVQNTVFVAAMLNVVAGLGLLACAGREEGGRRVGRGLAWAAALATPLLFVTLGRWDPLVMNAGAFLGGASLEDPYDSEIVFYAEGPDLTAAVRRSRKYPDQQSLTVNGKSDASTTVLDLPSMSLLGHFGGLLCERTGTACVVGLGGGMSLAGVARYPFERIDCVEISDEVIRAASYFQPYTYDVLSDPRVHLYRADGRNHLALTAQRYDLIVTQPSNPWIAGVANLFTLEYFRACRAALAPGGRMVAWLQAYNTDPEDFRMVVRTMAEAFPYLTVWESHGLDYVFIAGEAPFEQPLDELARRFYVPPVWADLLRAGVEHPGRIAGAFITGDGPLRAWSASAPVHTDDNALLEFSAARALYRDRAYAIAEQLHGLQTDPFGQRALAPSAAPALQSDVQVLVARASAARTRLVAALGRRAAGDALGMYQALMDGYRADRGNMGLLIRINQEVERLIAERRDLFVHPEHGALMRDMFDTRYPMLAPLTGAPVPAIMERNLERGRAAYDQGLYWRAVEHLEAARAMAAGDARVVEALAYAYARVGRLEEAIGLVEGLLAREPQRGAAHYVRAHLAVIAGDPAAACAHLERVLELGVMTRAQLAELPALAPLRDEPAFQRLVDGTAAAP